MIKREVGILINDKEKIFYILNGEIRRSEEPPFDTPLELIKQNEVFVLETEINPGSMSIVCKPGGVGDYIEALNDKELMRSLKTWLGVDSIPFLHRKVKELREYKINKIID